ncbi:thioredoxin superfamily protein isoform X1 [Tasmannia lanceolata]|uniref:thioredoxin superfamily protein isoform X1 n=1 Tax=Tasmannia lanceolata TaxID=3420 RepID=UPI004062C2DE
MGTNHPLPWLNLMVAEPFYLFHFLTFFSYFIVRSSATQALSSQFSDRLLHREIQAILAFLVLTVVKLVKEETWEAFIADTLFFAKGFLMAVALIMDYHLALCYMVGFLVIFVLTQQPAYHELGNASQLTPLQLETLLTEGNTSRFWLVEFRALCSSRCIRTSRFMSDLSITYSNKNFSFGTVDLGHFPNAAEKFGISLGVSMGQLPTYILFDNAVEVSRFPEVDYEAKASTPTIRKNLLCRHFELDRRLIDYVSGR